jgi:hypothetical protein
MTKLFDTPTVFELPLSKGGDLYVTFVYKPLLVNEDGDPILDGNGKRQYVESDYPTGSTVQLVIDGTTPIVVDGEITGSQAVFWEDKFSVDTAKNGKLWRVVLTYEGGLDQVLCNGTVVRADGQS